MKKITFLGDIMCEEPLLRASKRKDGYDFRQVFEGCKDFLAESDFVVGNLETVFAGTDSIYTNSLFSFNTPDEFAVAMADSGINMVTTATNHALDRDKNGLIRTLDLLDELGVEHIGAYRTEKERETICVKTFDKRKVAFLNYTYGTNLNESPYVIDEKEYYVLNLLMPQKKVASRTKRGLKGIISKVIYKAIPLKTLLKIKKAIGREYANKYTDKLENDALRESYIARIENDVKEARKHSDIIVVCLHIGGQFNEIPGDLVNFFSHKFSELGADFLINTHAHVVQGIEKIENTFVANCLGNFSISPSSVYVPHELLPEYSVALHMYVYDTEVKLTFSVLKILEDRLHNIKVEPVYDIAKSMEGDKFAELQKDVTFIYNRFTGNNELQIPIQKEYSIQRCN